MKIAELFKTIGATVFWVFFVGCSIIDVITHIQGCSDLWFLILRQVFAGFELFGISLEIVGWRLIKKENKRIKKESEETENG